MDLVLWIVQILLALAFLGAGLTHATRRDRATGHMGWMLAVPKPLLTVIGILEILGAIGLVVPWATGIATWLTPLAALCPRGADGPRRRVPRPATRRAAERRLPTWC